MTFGSIWSPSPPPRPPRPPRSPRSRAMVFFSLVRRSDLELQPAFARPVGQRLDAAVVAVVAAVERGLGDALGLGRLGQLLPDGLGRLDVAAVGGLGPLRL